MIAMATDPITDLVSRLEGVKQAGDGYSAKCPAHDDRNASLSVRRGNNGGAVVYCHAGCTLDAICSAISISKADLFVRKDNRGNAARRHVTETYPYVDAEGELLYEVIRYLPKDFRQRRPNGNGAWIYNMDSVQRVLYRLPDLLNSAEDRPGDWVFVCEGEKDVDALRAIGLIATCNVGGAGKWKDEYSECLRGRRVGIIADKDEPGRKHARAVAASLEGKAADVRVIECPGNGVKDASDFLGDGGTAEQLIADAFAATTEPEAESPADDEIKPQFASIAELAKSNPNLRDPIIEGLLRRGETMNVISVPKIGKSWMVLDLAISAVTGRVWLGKYPTIKSNVLIIDNELHTQTIANRIPKVASARGVMLSELGGLFVDSLRGRLRDIYAMDSYFRAIEPGKFGIIILDAFYRFLPREADENSNSDLAAIYNQIDRYADMLGCCFVLIHHSSKGVQANKSTWEVGSGGSSQARAADSHVIIRQHEVDGAVVVDAAVRSWPPVDPFCLRWSFPVWQSADDLNPNDLRQENRRKRKTEDAEPAPTTKADEPWTPQRFVSTFIKADAIDKRLIMARASSQGLSGRKTEDLIYLALADGLIHRWEPVKKTDPLRLSTHHQPLIDMGVKP
ncbi:MAG TPA: AAA family ATPase [Tepidisphaeraceae bacterium]|jgi:5S rRNA maturation endonuclease (ribonuclease M5)